MKSLFLTLALAAMATTASFAQSQNKEQLSTPAKATSLTPENIQFVNDTHDFGTVAEGAAADYVFQFKNTGKEPVIITRVQPSCGCTIPDWSKDPVMPGKTGYVKASYGTQGRPGHFEKSMTVFSNAGTKMVTFKGTVDKAPETSVPANGSMMRSN